MLNQRNLTEGAIMRHILALSLPIIASSFMQMAYNMTDIFWVGKLSADDISAVSAVGYIIWFGYSFSLIAKIGAEVMLSQSIGKERPHRLPLFIASALQLSTYLATVFSAVCIIFPHQIIDLIFSFNSGYVSHTAASYLRINAYCFVFLYLNPVFNGIMNGFGNTRTPFYILAVGLLLNIVLDPIFIFGVWIIPPMGTDGAAWASGISEVVSFAIFIVVFLRKRKSALSRVFSFRGNMHYMNSILKVGMPVAAQVTLFSVFAMLITRIVTYWGNTPVAVISIGANIEALSWMTAGGISTALSTFVGQNYGAKKMRRLLHGYFFALSLSIAWGIITTALLFFWGGDIVGMFNNDTDLISFGWQYMRIVSLSQIFMCIEIASSGALSGIGRTLPSAIVSIGFNALRVVAAYLLAFHTSLELEGVWWSISVSSVFKGTVLVVWFLFIFRQMKSRMLVPVRS